jgi:YD repeat-containing protein
MSIEGAQKAARRQTMIQNCRRVHDRTQIAFAIALILAGSAAFAPADPQLGTVSTTYTYDALNHLTSVAMPRNGYTQTRTFNYIYANNKISAYLQSATNPENGTVSYSYLVSDGSLYSKTDAKGQTVQYVRDPYGRVTAVQHTNPNDSNGNPVPPTVMRTYLYDTNFGDDPSYSQHAWGRRQLRSVRVHDLFA